MSRVMVVDVFLSGRSRVAGYGKLETFLTFP